VGKNRLFFARDWQFCRICGIGGAELRICRSAPAQTAVL